jgi:hypothetical protein
MKTVETFTATIYVGHRVGRTGQSFISFSIEHTKAIVQKYVDEVGLCVTVTPTTFVYTNDQEGGAIVGLINYPRFPSEPETIKGHALALAERLREGLSQWKVSVVMPQETIMLDGEPEVDSLPNEKGRFPMKMKGKGMSKGKTPKGKPKSGGMKKGKKMPKGK